MKILVINGPNLNFLGIREKNIYGNQDYDYLKKMLEEKAAREDVELEVWQSNHEGAIIDKLQECYFDGTDGIVINPGAYTHYSYAIRDALAVLVCPAVEVHISDVMNREDFRRISVISDVCATRCYGHGFDSYIEALDYIREAIGAEG